MIYDNEVRYLGYLDEGLVTQIKKSFYWRQQTHNTMAIHVSVETSFITAMDELRECSKGMMGIWLTQCGYLVATIH